MKDLTSCTPFLSQLATTDLCLLLKLPLPSYRDFIQGTTPRLRCPLQSTTYRLRRLPISNELTRYMPRSGKKIYYFSHFSGSLNGREVLCFEFFMHAASTKKIQ